VSRNLVAGCLFSLLLSVACGSGSPGPGSENGAGDSAAPKGPAWFVEESQSRGLVFTHQSGATESLLFPEIIGGGAALLDIDNDGDLDAYLVQSGDLRAPASAAGENRLFENRGDGQFEDITATSGSGDRGYGMGVVTGDYDNDGDVDIYVTNVGPNTLLRNNGDGTFTDATAASGTGDAGWGTSGAFLDYDNDGDLDLFVTNYVEWTQKIEMTCYNANGLDDYCLPTNYSTPAIDLLYRNEGDGSFTDVSESSGLRTAFGNGLGVAVGDFDANGLSDIFVANDTMLNQLWLNQGGGRFVDESLLRGCALDEHGKAKAGMGVGINDIDDDGDEDLLVVNLRGQTDSVFRNENGFFEDATGNFGLGQTSRWFTRFGVGLVDFDNDGHLDLFEANGRVVMNSESQYDDPYAEPNTLFHGQPEGRFEAVEPAGGVAQELVATSRAAAFGDVNGDGGMDVLIVNRDGKAHLLINSVSERGNWISLRVLDDHGRDALGAQLRWSQSGREMTRVVRSAYSYCAANDAAVHVGLGSEDQIDSVEVRWPDGSLETFGPLAAGGTVVVEKGSGR
jgi:hypothetical protein